MPAVAAAFIPTPYLRKRHATIVRAPAGVVLEVAERFDIQSVALVRALFWLRGRILGAKEHPPRLTKGLLADMTAIGWGVLARQPGRSLVMGAATRPWQGDARFTAIPPDRFAAFAEPGQVKIVWTLEAEPLGPARTRLATETRVEPTDEGARRRFRRYWRAFGAGIVLIRWLLLLPVRRQAERRFRSSASGGPAPRAR